MVLTQRVRMQSDIALAQWCTEGTLRRYLVARNWDVPAATKMLRNTLEWWVPYWVCRRPYGAYLPMPSMFQSSA